MANIDASKGFYPIRHLTGGEIRPNEYILTTGQTIYKGDVMKAVAGGTAEESDANDGVIVLGICAGYVDDSASVGGKKVLIWDDPNIVFGVQTDSGTASAATDVFTTANHVAGSGDSDTKLSGHELDSSQMAAQGGAQLKVLGLIARPDNEWGEHSDVEVIFNEHLYKAAVAGL